MSAEEQLAERLAKLTEEIHCTPTAAEPNLAPADPPGLGALSRIIRAYARQHQPQAATGAQSLFVWGHLDVLAWIGRGSFGEVYSAFDRVLEREVALKLRSTDVLAARAYIAEARRLARVRHPNVLAVHGAAIHDGRAGLWSDLIDGQTLKQWVLSSGPRPAAQVLGAASMLAAALQAVHVAGLIHGDVKPGNIMRDDDGRMVLMDFGTAIENAVDGVRLAYGSPLAMAPEQLDGSRVSNAIDIFALGVVLYFLACASYPFAAEPLTESRPTDVRPAVPDVALLTRRCGRPLADLITRMLALDPRQRPDASRVLLACQTLAQVPARRRRRLAIAAVVTTLSIALGVSLIGLVRVNAERKASELARQREHAVRNYMREFIAAPNPQAGGAELRVVDAMSDALPVAEARFAEQPEILVEVLGDIGISLFRIGARKQAAPVLLRAVELSQQQAVPADQRLLLEVYLAGSQAYALGPGALPERLQTLFENSRAALGPAHPVTIEAALQLSRVHNARNELAAAEALARYVLKQLPATSPPPYARVIAQLYLVRLFGHQQRWQEAEEIMSAAVESMEAAAAMDSPLGLLVRNGWASLESRRGHYAEAEQQVLSLLRDTENRYGQRHPSLRSELNDLAIAQRMLGKPDQAVANLRRALDLARNQVGEDHPEVLSFRGNLASALFDMGDHQAALVMREELLVTTRRVLGKGDQRSVIAGINLAEQYIDIGEYARALALARETAVNAAEALGDDHQLALEPREMAARAKLGLGDAANALSELKQLCQSKRRVLGEENLYTLRCAGFAASAEAASGNPVAAQARLQQTIDLLQLQVGDDQPDLRRMRTQLTGLSEMAAKSR